MEIDSNLVVQLIQGQSKTQQQITDLSQRLLGGDGQQGAIPYLANEHKELGDRVDKVEKKMYWFSGAGTALGATAGYLAAWIKKG